MSNSTVVNKRGRKPSPDSLVFKTVGLTPDQWRWLELWFPSSSPTSQLQELFNRAMKFWPAGPFALDILGNLAVWHESYSNRYPRTVHSLYSKTLQG